MAKYIVNQKVFLFANDTDTTTGGHPILDPFTVFEGTQDGAMVHKTDDPQGFVDGNRVRQIPDTFPPITDDPGRTAFCRTVTGDAVMQKASRDYLVAVAYFLSKNLSEFGKPGDARVGPFGLSLQDWRDSLADAAAAGQPLRPVDLFNATQQAAFASVRTAKAMAEYATKVGSPALPLDLFFFERMKGDGIDLLKNAKQAPTTTCANAITGAAPDGSYAAEIKAKGAKPIGDHVREVTEGLMSGFGFSRADVNRLPILLRYFTAEDWAPWLAVARIIKGDALQASTDKLAALFMSTIPGTVSPSAAFVAFCMIFCGDTTVRANLPGAHQELPSAWAAWGLAAPDPAPAGSVVLTDSSVSQGIGILAAPASGDTLQVYLCSRANGAVKVEMKTIARTAVTALRWLDLSIAPATRTPGAGDALFVQKAPKIMADLLNDFPALKDFQAAGILGNIGQECGGFNSLQEIRPTGQDGRGGLGWCQWTDSRRSSFETWAATHDGVASNKANYTYLCNELSVDFRNSTLVPLKLTTTLDGAMRSFEETFEKARQGEEGFPNRLRYAEIALNLFRGTLD